jgi:hypothetical protein
VTVVRVTFTIVVLSRAVVAIGQPWCVGGLEAVLQVTPQVFTAVQESAGGHPGPGAGTRTVRWTSDSPSRQLMTIVKPGPSGVWALPTVQLSTVQVRTTRRSGGLNAEVVAQRQLDFRELITSQVVHGVTHQVVGVDRADLVDEQAGSSAGDLQLGAVDRRAGRSRRRDDRHDREWRIGRRQDQTQPPATLLVAPCPTNVRQTGSQPARRRWAANRIGALRAPYPS